MGQVLKSFSNCFKNFHPFTFILHSLHSSLSLIIIASFHPSDMYPSQSTNTNLILTKPKQVNNNTALVLEKPDHQYHHHCIKHHHPHKCCHPHSLSPPPNVRRMTWFYLIRLTARQFPVHQQTVSVFGVGVWQEEVL